MRICMTIWRILIICFMLLCAGACAHDAYEPENVVRETVLTQEPDGTEVDEVDIFGFKRTQQGIEVNPSASESLQIDLYDPQSFWNGAFDRNWMEYGW